MRRTRDIEAYRRLTKSAANWAREKRAELELKEPNAPAPAWMYVLLGSMLAIGTAAAILGFAS